MCTWRNQVAVTETSFEVHAPSILELLHLRQFVDAAPVGRTRPRPKPAVARFEDLLHLQCCDRTKEVIRIEILLAFQRFEEFR